MASFKEAFASARKSGKKNFTWNGKSYNTKVKDSVDLPKTAPTPTKRPANMKKGMDIPSPSGPATSRFGSGSGAKTEAGKALAAKVTQPKTTEKTSRPVKKEYEKSYDPFTNKMTDKSYNPFTNKVTKKEKKK